MIITDVGMNAILQSEASGYVYKIDIGAIKLGALNTNLGTGATELPGGPVYTFNTDQIKYTELDSAGTPSKYILIQTDMDSTVGDFTYGSVGVYLESGELFAYDIFSIYPKNATNLPEVYGDHHRRFYGLICKNITDMVTLDYDVVASTQFPSVAHDGLLPTASDVPYMLYLVAKISSISNKPGLAYSNGTSWIYSTLDQQGLAGIDVSSTFTGNPSASGDTSIAFGNSTIQGDDSMSLGDSHGIGDRILVGFTGNSTTTYGEDQIVFGDRNSGGLTSARHHNIVTGGSQNLAAADYVSIFGGEGNRGNADYTTLMGKRSKATTKGEKTHAVGMFSREGDAQHSEFIFKLITNSTNSTEMFADTNGRLFVELDSATFFYGKLLMVRPGALYYAWDVSIRVENTTLGGIAASLTVTARPEYFVPALTVLSITISNIDSTLRLNITAPNSSVTRWVLDLAATRVMW